MTLCSERKREKLYFFNITMHLTSEIMSQKVRYTTLRTTETKVTAVRLKTNPLYRSFATRVSQLKIWHF